jgi:hypothetical protein
MRFHVLTALLLGFALAMMSGCYTQRSTEPVTKTGNPFDRGKRPAQ